MLPTVLEGACVHNLKSVSLTLLPGELVVVTGVSGAGKSSLAMDTLYAEGQRRFVESFSPYARQFLERLERPNVRAFEPVPAGIAVDRRTSVKSSRSTLATMADLEPYLSALFVREAVPVCKTHDREAERLDPESAARRAHAHAGGARSLVAYPVAANGNEAYLELRDSLTRDGYRRLLVGGVMHDIDDVRPSAAVSAELRVVLDRVSSSDFSRVAQSIETAWTRGAGTATFHAEGLPELLLRKGLGCPVCAESLPAPRAGLFSYESPLGACPVCRGFGRTLGVDLDKVIPDPERTLAKGAIRPWRGASTRWERSELAKLCRRHGIALDQPWQKLSKKAQRLVLEGDGSWDAGLFPGVLGWFRWLETKTYKLHVRVLLARYRAYDVCHACTGKRLNEAALSFRVGGLDLAAWHGLEVSAARRRLEALATTTGQGELARRELLSRLGYLERVGLGYLSLDRQARTLSGGEAQRVTLTAALGTSLNNALFVLDEPTVGLHPSDVAPLVQILRELSQRDNVVVVVEHDPSVIAGADRVIELGPSAGERGGNITADAPPRELANRPELATGRALLGPERAQRTPRSARGSLSLKNAREHNLAGVDLEIPLGVLCAITGPSGSGKSSLAVDVVYRALARRFGDLDAGRAGDHDALVVNGALSRVTLVDQSPLGRTSRGNAATYTRAWDCIRALYAKQPGAVARELGAAAFSFNVEGGRCEACAGEGAETVEMQFLADVRLTCPTCRGLRFKDEVLAVERDGVNIAGVLAMTVERALEVFKSEPAILRSLGPLAMLGLGYLTLGQPLSTLSGGEAQRLKLSRALAEGAEGALFVLDEPSAGLHIDEVERVSAALHQCVDAGASVIVVEHDLDLILEADHVIDMGPGSGALGGQVVAQGTPEQLASSSTRTGRALSQRLEKRGLEPSAAPRPKLAAVARELTVTRAREHNLAEVSVTIPHGALSVVTGPSGSGKSTLAFDVVFAEGQRRFLETLTPYARQFLPTMPRPDVDSVSGIPPSIALEQRTARTGGQSTVATVTEVAHYLRLLYARLGVAHCPDHDLPIATRTPAELLADARRGKQRAWLLAPAVAARKGTYLDVFSAAARAGIAEAFADGERVSTESPPKLARSREHTIDLVVTGPLEPKRLDLELVTRALGLGKGSLKLRSERGEEALFSTLGACPKCGFSVPELDPRWFSFATQQGRCERCEGKGVLVSEKSVGRGKQRRIEIHERECPECEGSRLAPIPRSVRLCGERYHELLGRSVSSALARVRKLGFKGDAALIANPLVAELERRLVFLCDTGLDYLALDRPAHTLSGGEMQRLRLAAQLGAGLTGALYVLDEPTIGLHPSDTGRLIGNLRRLVELGSTVVVVEHDTETIRAADHLIDLGPGGGRRGGHITAAGPPEAVLSNTASPTGRALSRAPEIRSALAIDESRAIVLEGAAEHNLKAVDARFPLGRFTAVCGVSGSGKSTLINRVLLPAVRKQLGLTSDEPGAFSKLSGIDSLRRAIAIDQSPIGRTPRSVPATFLGIWDQIRKLFAQTPEAQIRGFSPQRFSFNSAGGGRCPGCDGQGAITHEMSFLPDVIAACPACGGLRFEPRTLEVRYQGRSIGDVLALTAEEGAAFFENHRTIAAPLRTLCDLGAGYVSLGQGSHTLSGGEAQRLKLAAELTASLRHEPTLYVLDEPTTGLHVADVECLVRVLGRLVERGDTLVVIEHHPQVLAGADYLIELGPEGGERGGRRVAEGPPRKVARGSSATAAVVREMLKTR